MIEEQIVTPPARTPLLEDGGPRGSQITSRDWWLYWNQLTLRGNRNAADIDKLEAADVEIKGDISGLDRDLDFMLRSDTHAERLATSPDPADALWVETDRQNVVYQAQIVGGGFVWRYVAGAMWGTIIAVDERPTDLGANDVGFLFLSSDSASVRWSGTVWEPFAGQTPWRQNIDAAGFALNNLGAVNMQTPAGVATKFSMIQAAVANWDIQVPASVNALTFGQGGSERLRVTLAGNVGINKTNPGSKLAVSGLPTSASGLTSGDIWYDTAAGNVLKIVP